MKPNNLFSGVSEPATVDDYMKQLDHPMKELAEYLRKVILSADVRIGEGIYWNAPTFYYTGKMKPFDQKEYKRYIVGFNFYRQDTIRLVFLRGADASDPSGLLTGDFKDRRKIAMFKSIGEIKRAENELIKIIKDLVKKIDH